MAETLRMARIPVRRALDIGSGPGFLLDALAELVPSLAKRVHGVERFPPPPQQRSRSPNYHVGSIADLEGTFDAGVCIEVIEHLTPTILASLLRQLAGKSSPGALYFFNSAQPSFVEAANPGYLSPYYWGHLIAWSIAGARMMFEPAGFNLIALPGRDWAFLAEFGPPRPVGIETLVDWLWRPRRKISPWSATIASALCSRRSGWRARGATSYPPPLMSGDAGPTDCRANCSEADEDGSIPLPASDAYRAPN